MANPILLDDDTGFGRTPYKNAVRAEKGKRFLNYVIDQIGIYGLTFLVGIIMALGLPESTVTDFTENENGILDWVFGIILSLLYYVAFEAFAGGKTLGKYVTKTRAVNEDGSEMDGSQTLIRILCRLVPFDALSFLGEGTGWHDKWSKTIVVEDRTKPGIGGY